MSRSSVRPSSSECCARQLRTSRCRRGLRNQYHNETSISRTSRYRYTSANAVTRSSRRCRLIGANTPVTSNTTPSSTASAAATGNHSGSMIALRSGRGGTQLIAVTGSSDTLEIARRRVERTLDPCTHATHVAVADVQRSGVRLTTRQHVYLNAAAQCRHLLDEAIATCDFERDQAHFPR